MSSENSICKRRSGFLRHLHLFNQYRRKSVRSYLRTLKNKDQRFPSCTVQYAGMYGGERTRRSRIVESVAEPNLYYDQVVARFFVLARQGEGHSLLEHQTSFNGLHRPEIIETSHPQAVGDQSEDLLSSSRSLTVFVRETVHKGL